MVHARRIVLGLIAAGMTISLAGAALAEPARAEVGLNLKAPSERTRALNTTHPGHLLYERRASFGLGDATYTVQYRTCIDEAHAPEVSLIEGYLGMPGPSSANWYHGGFLSVDLNGRTTGTTPLSSMMVVERGERAMLDLVWHDKLANVRVRFIGLPGYDCLFCEVTIEPIEEITSVGLKLTCFPSYFTAHHKRAGARRIQTPAELVMQGPPVTLPLDENWWGVYYDETFDVAKGEGEGPCSMLIVPEGGGEVNHAPHDYAVNSMISLPAETTRVRMAFWDHKGMTNADALSLVGDRADDVRAMLEQADFTPVAVREFDVAAAREQVEQALASENTRLELAEQIAEIEKWLDANAAAADDEDATPGVLAQEELLQSIDMYNSFKWQVLLTELLENI